MGIWSKVHLSRFFRGLEKDSMLPARATASEKDCKDAQSNSTHALQELKDAMQQHKALQQAAAAAETHAADAAQCQAEHAEENAALRQEIQVRTLRTSG